MATGCSGDGEGGDWNMLLVEVDRSDAVTLLPLIQQHIRPGSMAYSDEWSAYNQLGTVTGCNLQTVNHSVHFVDPNTGAHTQGVQSMWSCCKRMLKESAMHSRLHDTYLPEFMWRRQFGGPLTFANIFQNSIQCSIICDSAG